MDPMRSTSGSRSNKKRRTENMNKWFKIGLIGLLVFGVAAVLITSVALAQDVTPTTTLTTGVIPVGRGPGRGLGGQVGLEAAANALGMTAEELSAELWAGKSLADIADEKGKSQQ